MKSIKNALFLFVAIIALGGISSSTAFACSCEPGTGTPGYWKNHPDAWPVDGIIIGGVPYTKDEAIAIMETPVKGDKSITMFNALVAAKLNLLIISCDCSPLCIVEADQWLVYFPVLSGITANTEAWQYSHGEALYWCMDDFNNGRLCAPSRDYCENSF